LVYTVYTGVYEHRISSEVVLATERKAKSIGALLPDQTFDSISFLHLFFCFIF
jgi:hypothetical protein